MSTARDELTRLCDRENANTVAARDDFDVASKVIRYSDEYAKYLNEAKLIISVAEQFTQGSEAKRLAMADAFNQQHRSHQQGFVRGVVIPVLAVLEMHKQTNYLDARNQGAADFAEAALNAADERNATWMPFI